MTADSRTPAAFWDIDAFGSTIESPISSQSGCAMLLLRARLASLL